MLALVLGPIMLVGNLILGVLALRNNRINLYGKRQVTGQPAKIIGILMIIGGLLAPFVYIGGFLAIVISLAIGFIAPRPAAGSAWQEPTKPAAVRVGEFWVEPSPQAPYEPTVQIEPGQAGDYPAAYDDRLMPGAQLGDAAGRQSPPGTPNVSEWPTDQMPKQPPPGGYADYSSPVMAKDRPTRPPEHDYTTQRIPPDSWELSRPSPPVSLTPQPQTPGVPRPPAPIDRGVAPPVAVQPAQPPSLARLEVVRGNLSRSVFHIYKVDYLIGRGRDADLQLLDPKVSRAHARLRFGQGNWYIQDQGSMSGILVNGQRVDAVRLQSGDEITVANFAFIFRAD